MREILFRGKCLSDGEWEEGFYVRMHDSKGRVAHRIHSGYTDNIYGNFYSDDLSPEGVEVDPSTIGQYTGLCDKNGKKIFEGDICQVGHLLYKVEFAFSQWKFRILSNKVYCYPAFNSHCGEHCIIIGNIHDNPELLEGEG